MSKRKSTFTTRIAIPPGSNSFLSCKRRQLVLLLAFGLLLGLLRLQPLPVLEDVKAHMCLTDDNAMHPLPGRLAVLSICKEGDPMAKFTGVLNQAYCRKHQCTFILVPFQGKGEVEKLYAVQEVLNSRPKYYECTLWLDCDAAFVNPHVPPQRILELFELDNSATTATTTSSPIGFVMGRQADHKKDKDYCLKPQRDASAFRPQKGSYHRDECYINSGVFAVRSNAQGLAALKELIEIMDPPANSGQEALNNQAAFDELLWRHGHVGLSPSNSGIRVVCSEMMNRHLPPNGFGDNPNDDWSPLGFRQKGVWSCLPTLVAHPCGQPKETLNGHFECTARELLLDDLVEYNGNITVQQQEIALDRCSHWFRYWYCLWQSQHKMGMLTIQQCSDYFDKNRAQCECIVKKQELC